MEAMKRSLAEQQGGRGANVSESFKVFLASELLALERSIVAACECEILQLGERERERGSERLGAAEAEARRLEKEVQKISAEKAELLQQIDAQATAAAAAAAAAAAGGEQSLEQERQRQSAVEADARRLEQQVQRLRAENAELLRCTLQGSVSAGTCQPQQEGTPPSRTRASANGRTITPSRSGPAVAAMQCQTPPSAHAFATEDGHRQRPPPRNFPTPPDTGAVSSEQRGDRGGGGGGVTPPRAKHVTLFARGIQRRAKRTTSVEPEQHTAQVQTPERLRRLCIWRAEAAGGLAHEAKLRQADPEENAQRGLRGFDPGVEGAALAVVLPICAKFSQLPGLRSLPPAVESERKQGEFEAVTVFEERGAVVVHNCLFHSDLVRMFVNHANFSFNRTFGPSAPNEEVCMECGSPLVTHAMGGQLATLFMFGQTGSGKTYTMDAILHFASQQLFAQLNGTRGKPRVLLKAFEIIGKKCVDLLSDERADIKLLEDDNGDLNIVGATELVARCPEECQRTIGEALEGRTTGGHGRNDESSRSHCVCMVEIPATGGSLIFADCAGTERRQDTDQHTTERTRESAEINTSLHALKECIRYWQLKEQRASRNGGADEHDEDEFRQVRVPYRGSQLTRLLQESFTRPQSRLFALGTVSPAAMDTEHSLSTLKTLQLLQHEATCTESKVDVPGPARQKVERSCSATSRRRFS
eukprot:CAMPEP_0117622128 /NCGR_PEP_ID=MMETSP0784-20121206/87983_1 /TAXON_ID=39447 /ORGANISM="" /LENGTH=701 /DNA_ID=CAMNT_0005426061 /DNA_START=25 /DNA_END=2132 /DNA_ORIENTATION=-